MSTVMHTIWCVYHCSEHHRSVPATVHELVTGQLLTPAVKYLQVMPHIEADQITGPGSMQTTGHTQGRPIHV